MVCVLAWSAQLALSTLASIMAISSLQTYGDWCSFLERGKCVIDTQMLDSIARGTFESGAEAHMLLLIKKTLENSLNFRTASFQKSIREHVVYIDDFVLLCKRYEANCRVTLSLCSVAGLPAAETKELTKEAKAYVRSVFLSLRANCALGAGASAGTSAGVSAGTSAGIKAGANAGASVNAGANAGTNEGGNTVANAGTNANAGIGASDEPSDNPQNTAVADDLDYWLKKCERRWSTDE